MTTEETTNADSASALSDGLERLLPCPFCGAGTTDFQPHGQVWTGMKYGEPITWSVRHWCADIPGPSRMIERIGRDKEQAIERWNMRSNAGVSGAAHKD